LDWNIIKLILTKFAHSDLLRTSFKIKKNNEVWLKTSKQQILAMKTKFSKNRNIFLSYSIKAPCSTMI
jgi:hypothetical protein